MCLITLAWRVHPQYPLVLLANRDEYHARPTAEAAWWPEQPSMLAGRDLSAGGTWLGVTTWGGFAALTNYRGIAPQASRPSRGTLIPAILEEGLGAAQMLERLAAAAPAHNAFNVLLSDGTDLAVFESVRGTGRLLEAGIYGLSNHLLDTPWPKLLASKRGLEALVRQRAFRPAMPPDLDRLLALLRDRTTYPDETLPSTGVDTATERLLSSIFICSPQYGTRSSTLLVQQRDGHCGFREWTWNPAGERTGEVVYRFDLG